jgi:hypothetical protein
MFGHDRRDLGLGGRRESRKRLLHFLQMEEIAAF